MLLLAALGVLGAALVLAQEVRFGVGLHRDSVIYISVARSLLAGDGFTQFNGEYLLSWPPLYPLLLAGASLGAFDPRAVAGPLNAAIFGLTVFIAGSYLRARLESRLLPLGGALATALAWPLAAEAAWALSETLFILLIILALIQADRALRAPGAGAGPALSALIWAAAFAALAGLTRYMGVALVAAIVPLLALQRGVALPAKALRIIIYTLIALAPLALWLLRNHLLVGSTTGARNYPVALSAAEILYANLNIIAEWLLPAPPFGYFVSPAAYALLGLWIALLALASAVALRAHRNGVASAAQHAQLLLTGFAAAHLAAIIGARLLGWSEIIAPRYLAPTYLPLLLATLLALAPALRPMFRQNCRQKRRRIAAGASAVLLAGLLLWLAYQIPVNARAIREANIGHLPLRGHNNYAHPQWTDSPALRYLRAELADGAVFSTDDAAVYIHSGGLDQYRQLPCGENELRRRLSDAGAAGPVYLLWLYDVYYWCPAVPDYHGGLAGLLAAVPAAPIAAFPDGVLFRYIPEADAAASADTTADTTGDIGNDTDTDSWRDLRQRYAAVSAGAPLAAGRFDLRRHAAPGQNWLIYTKEPCAPDDGQAPFFLHLVPANTAYLSAPQRRHGIDNRDFEFARDGVRFADQCMVSIRLPAYAIAQIRTGQYAPGAGRLWAVEYPGRFERLRAARDAAARQPPVARADFAVYYHDRRLIYAKTPCAPADTAAPFFLHIVPVASADLPADRRQHGFENRDFAFDQAGMRRAGQCIATVELPDYDLAAIRTGQYVPDAGRRWTAEFAPPAR